MINIGASSFYGKFGDDQELDQEGLLKELWALIKCGERNESEG
jgi:hypothetical protein